MKVVLLGCQQICADFLEFLAREPDVTLLRILTSERPHDSAYGYQSVRETGRRLGYRVDDGAQLTDGLVRELIGLQPDVIFSAYYRRILPQRLLAAATIGAFNVHPSLLPKYRGRVPSAWAILHGESTTGVTIHVMDAGVDTGDILVQEAVPIEPEETGFELHTKLMRVGSRLLVEHFWDIVKGRLSPRKQIGAGSYFGALPPRAEIDWTHGAERIKNLIRVYAPPYAAAESMLGDRRAMIARATVVSGAYGVQEPGRIVDVSEGTPVVSCGDGFLRLDDFELSPAPPTPAERDEYLRATSRFASTPA